jgi:conjugal transfer pilus assembly protein TraV
MIRHVSLLTIALALSGCATASTTHSWSCRATGPDVCASVATIDNRPAGTAARPKKTSIFGAQVASWWDQNRPTAQTREDAPRRESDQTMRILIAPYVDGQGDYHDRAEVYAVMRKAQWWIVPPSAVPVPAKASADVATKAPAPADAVKTGAKP